MKSKEIVNNFPFMHFHRKTVTADGHEKIYDSMKHRWVVNSLSIIVAIIVAIVLLVCFIFSQYYYSSVSANLSNRAVSTAQLLNLMLARNYEEFYYKSGQMVSEFADRDKLEFQIIDSTGRILFSSSGIASGFSPSTEDVAQCLSGISPAVWTGVNQESGERVMSVSAVLKYSTGQTAGAVRFTTSLTKVDKAIFSANFFTCMCGLAIFFLVFLSNHYFIRSIVNPIVKLNDLTRKIAAGSYGIQLESSLDDEIGELCDSINYMSKAISDAEKVKNDIISSLSHELRTPLTAIGGWSETLLSAESNIDPKLLSQGLGIIHKESFRLSHMVEQLLDFSRLESGRFTLQTEVFDLRGEFSDASFLYKDILKRDDIVLRYDEEEEPIMVNGDRNRIRQVFLNLLDNAAKYGGGGGVIELSLTTDQDYAVACVKDNGAGISPEDLPRITEKFYRGTSQTVHGTGIGLSVCDEIIRLHNGELKIESTLGEGTCVTVRLPLQKSQSIN